MTSTELEGSAAPARAAMPCGRDTSGQGSRGGFIGHGVLLCEFTLMNISSMSHGAVKVDTCPF